MGSIPRTQVGENMRFCCSLWAWLQNLSFKNNHILIWFHFTSFGVQDTDRPNFVFLIWHANLLESNLNVWTNEQTDPSYKYLLHLPIPISSSEYFPGLSIWLLYFVYWTCSIVMQSQLFSVRFLRCVTLCIENVRNISMFLEGKECFV